MNDILQRIEALRESREITIYKLAKSVGIPQSTYVTWIEKDRIPKVDKLQKIADYFDVTVEYLITGNDSSIVDEPLTMDVSNELRFITGSLFECDSVYWGGAQLSEHEICALLKLLRNFVDFVDVIYKNKEQT